MLACQTLVFADASAFPANSMGFPPALFVQPEIVKGYTCPICLDVVEEPTLCQSGHTCVVARVAPRLRAVVAPSVLTCARPACTTRTRHSFCRACILAALARKPACPLDRGVLTQATLVPNRMVAAYLEELPARCAHAAAAAGADDAAPEDDNAADCAWMGSLSMLSQHLRSDCGAETVACPHAASGCGAAFRRRDANAHAAVCAHEPVACTVPGCAARLAPGALDAHMRDAAEQHVPLLQAALSASEARCEALAARVTVHETGGSVAAAVPVAWSQLEALLFFFLLLLHLLLFLRSSCCARASFPMWCRCSQTPQN
jgi:hypothetical protein